MPERGGLCNFVVDNATIKMKRIAIFASGSGTNALNIINYFNGNAGNGAEVALVVCNRKDAGIVPRAEAVGVPVLVMTRNEINDEKLMPSVLEQYKVDIIALAGFLLMVPSFIIERYEGKIVNIHPSLLPKFGGKGMFGANVHRAVVESGEKETGITIHYVSEHCDGGQIIFQAKVAVTSDDTPETVEAKVHALEYEHYPRIIKEKLL